MRRAFAAVVCALFAALAAVAPVPAVAADDPLLPLAKAIERQDRLTRESRFDELVREAETAAKDGTAESLYLLGRALGNTALAKMESAQRTEPDDPVESARLLKEADGLLDSSRDAFERSREAGALVYAPALLGLARCSRYRGDLDGATAYLRQALAIDRDFKAAVLDLAQVHFEKGLHADGEFELYRFLERHPKEADARLLLGVMKSRRKRFGEAELEFRTVLEQDSANESARKLLAANLMHQEKFAEAAEHCEGCRRLDPKDDEPYRMLFSIYRRLGRKDDALQVLEDLKREFPGKMPGLWAERALEELAKDPSVLDAPAGRSREELIHRLGSKEPEVVRKALADMKALAWPALPAAVYGLLGRGVSTPEVRAQAVALIGAQRDPLTLPILEILLYHPKERDASVEVRRVAARGVAGISSPAALPILRAALAESDPEIREAAVAGFAELTGWWFREDLTVPTPDDAWPAERERIEKWWRESRAASTFRRDAVTALQAVFDPITRGRTRLATYALEALDDPNEATWRAGYGLFRSMTRHDFGATTGPVSEEERSRVAREARAWLATNADREDGQ